MSKIIASILIISILWFQYRIWYGDNGKQKLEQMQIKIAQQKNQNKLLVEQNLQLKTEIKRLRTQPKVLEEKAREQLGLIKDDEIFYRVIPAEEKDN